MPGYKGHLSGGFLVFIIILLALNLFAFKNKLGISSPQAFLYLFLCLLGSLFPDIDTKSKIQKWIYYPLFFIIIFAILLKNWVLVSFLSVIALIPILANHRHLTHKIWFVMTVPIIPTFLLIKTNTQSSKIILSCYLFFVIGAFSHIILDFGPKRFFRKF